MPLTRHVHSLLLKRIKLVMINLVMHYFKDNTCIYLYTRPCLLSTSCSQLYKHLNFQVVRDIVHRIHLQTWSTWFHSYSLWEFVLPEFYYFGLIFGFPGDALSIKIHPTVYFFFQFSIGILPLIVMVVIA